MDAAAEQGLEGVGGGGGDSGNQNLTEMILAGDKWLPVGRKMTDALKNNGSGTEHPQHVGGGGFRACGGRRDDVAAKA